jgi:hypothetical protein
MKKLVAVAVVVASLLAPSVADAHTLSKDRAFHRSITFERGICNDSRNCKHYGVARCVRVSRHRVNCLGWEEYKSMSGRKTTCDSWLRWRLHRSSNLLSLNTGDVRCVSGWRY